MVSTRTGSFPGPGQAAQTGQRHVHPPLHRHHARPRPAPRHARRRRLTPPGPPAPRPGQGGPARPGNPAPPAPRLAPGPASARPRQKASTASGRRSPADGSGMSAARAWLSFRRIVDIPFGTCAAALGCGQLTGPDGGRRAGRPLACGPAEHDPATGSCRADRQVRRAPAQNTRISRTEHPNMQPPVPSTSKSENAPDRRFRRSLPMGRLSRSVTRAECSAGADDRYAGDGGLAQESLHEPAGMPGHSPRPRSGKVARSQGDDGSSSSAQRCNSGKIALRSARP